MEKEQRNRLQKATQDARRLLEEEFRSQLLQTYDIDVEKVRWAEEPGAHLQAEQRLIREKLVAWIEHKEAQINDRKEALLLALREMAFTALNRFVALKLMEARELVRPCVSGGMESAGFLEFTAVAQGLLADQESSYRLYLETIFEDVSRELRALFDPRDPASLLWPKRAALLELLDILNRPELAELWSEDETLGWVYQYFNGDAERKKMREESAAPRNSRELAVRNQFFTPRYVVEFLTDNTLGRIWYEMRQGKTELKDLCRYLVRRPNEVWLQPGEEPPRQPDTDETFSQEELLRQPVYIPHRPLKDPREIRMLDPACGSMHFGLYAFDLYLEIYKEAWEIAQGSDDQSKEEEAFSPFVAYAAAFADKSAFLREVPKLILQHNIHGIDIDPRATQIARLTLWLRAQRAWQEQRLQVADRSVITRSNVVCAEPMPGERKLLADFVDQQFPEEERGLMQQLLETIFDRMYLAGEAGTLLKIEEEIRLTIDDSRRDWQRLGFRQSNLFGESELAHLGGAGESIIRDLANITRDFWVDIEDKIYIALAEFARQVADAFSFKRQLFVDDAEQGFAFIDVCRRHYDVCVMNPPFGLASKGSKSYVVQRYSDNWKDIYAAFSERLSALSWPGGLVGAITPSTWQYSRQLRDFRISMLSSGSPLVLAELGGGVMDDAAVEASIWISCNCANNHVMYALDLLGCPREERERQLSPQNLSWKRFQRGNFDAIEDSPYCHHLPQELVDMWRGEERFGSIAEIAKGNTTFDDFRFLRLWHEVPERESEQRKWIPYRSGGDFQPFYASTLLKINWESDGREVREWGRSRHGSDAQVMQSSRLWLEPGLAYPRVGGGFAVRVAQPGEIFSGHSIFVKPHSDEDSLISLGLLNSDLALALFAAHGRNRLTETVAIKDLPLTPSVIHCNRHQVAELVIEAVSLVAEWESSDETKPIFYAPDLRACASDGNAGISPERRIGNISQEISRLIREELKTSICTLPPPDALNWKTSRAPEDLTALLMSYLLGCAYGRWNISLCVNEASRPELINPFAALPKRPPGQRLGSLGLPLTSDYLSDNSGIGALPNGILVVDTSSDYDIEARLRRVLEEFVSMGSDTDSMLVNQAFSPVLDAVRQRDYFGWSGGFFADHLKRYSKSRRQAPIYWQLSAGSGSYSAWLYYHNFTQDTLYRLLRDFVEPRIQQAEREQFELESQGALSGDAATRLQETQTLLQDLRMFKSELDLVAPLWNPNLNDGVIINHAILWRITPYTPWQKKCKECWDKLVKGDYDWAHLTFHLWPERVIPKCTTDRSLAIAHGLEERLWQETNNGNWLPRQLSEADLQALIAEHSNPAVKSALERLLAAPPPVAPTRTRASRSTRASGSSTPRRARGSAAVVDVEATRQVLLALTAAPSDGLAKTQIADLIGVEANAITAVIKQLKESGQIDQLGERRGARYVLSEQGRAVVAADAGGDE